MNDYENISSGGVKGSENRQSGVLPFFRFGKSVRFLESDVYDFIRSQRIAAAVV